MFVGDPHGESTHIIQAVQASRPTATVLLGDLCYDTPIDEIYAGVSGIHWVHGNHDTAKPKWFDSLFESAWSGQSLHASVRDVAGVRIAGLGGIFRPKIWHPDAGVMYANHTNWRLQHSHKRYAQLDRKHHSSIWYDDYIYLANQKADILVMHEAPSSHKFGHKVLDELAEVMDVKLLVHGHHHTHYTSILPNGIAVVGLGLAQTSLLHIESFMQAESAAQVLQSFSFGKDYFRRKHT